jgi:two-component system chemotaxis response regulator CheB
VSKKKINTLLIDDSGLMRIILSDLLREDSRINLLATASNGRDGVAKAKALKPDVVITNMIMPLYDGLFVVKTLMKDMPLPIILISSLQRSDPQIFDALQEGAFAFLEKPQKHDISNGYPRLKKLVHKAIQANDLDFTQDTGVNNITEYTSSTHPQYDIIAIGVSTGGPKAIEHIVHNLPRTIDVPIIIAQHMPESFIESFASRLNETSVTGVSVVTDGEVLNPNRIYLAPGTSNIRIYRNEDQKPAVRFVKDVYKEFNNPSIDCLFESIAEIYRHRAMAIVLTGMGKDGTVGLTKIKEQRGLTVAQDEASSVVYGMPKVAFESGAATHQLPITEIPDFIIHSLYSLS